MLRYKRRSLLSRPCRTGSAVGANETRRNASTPARTTDTFQIATALELRARQVSARRDGMIKNRSPSLPKQSAALAEGLLQCYDGPIAGSLPPVGANLPKVLSPCGLRVGRWSFLGPWWLTPAPSG